MIEWKGNTAVITAVTNDYDHIGPHSYTDGVDYIFFSDGSTRPPDSHWQHLMLPKLSHLNNRRLSKLPKIYPHYFDILIKYRYIIWIDGDMQIKKSEFVPEILSFLKEGLVLSPHFDDRHCAYGEARPNKYPGEPVQVQVDYYRNEGFPEDFGLFEAGVNARDMHKTNLLDFEQTWLFQNLLFAPQDQLSLPYSLWKTNISYDKLPSSFRDFEWLGINAHKSGKH